MPSFIRPGSSVIDYNAVTGDSVTTAAQKQDIALNDLYTNIVDGTAAVKGIVQLGTTATTAALGNHLHTGVYQTAGSCAASGANSDITSLTGLTTPLSVAQGGTGSTTASNARTALGLGDSATKNVGTAAGTVAAGDDSRFDAMGADESARNLAIRNAIKLGILAADASGSVPSGYLHLFATDELATKTNAAYDSTNKRYAPTAASWAEYTPTGSAFGNMTINGGLAAAFDGNTSQAHAACAGITATTGYDGKAFSAPQKISRVGVYGSNNWGYTNTGTGTITVNVYGKATAPGSATDGALLGSISFANTSNESSVRYVTTDDTTAYQYVWAVVSTSGGGEYVYFAEIKYFTTSAVNNMTLIPLAITAGASPKSIDLCILHKAVDAVTLNTDLKIRVTLDGTNWSGYGTLVDLGQYDANYKLLRAKIDTSALTGTSGIKWELTTYNAKSQQVRATAMLLNL